MDRKRKLDIYEAPPVMNPPAADPAAANGTAAVAPGVNPYTGRCGGMQACAGSRQDAWHGHIWHMPALCRGL